MAWCEANEVSYLFGLPKNQRLLKVIGKQQQEAKVAFEQTGQASRVFYDFEWRTKKSWSRLRRVVAKAEHLAKGANPRFVVTNLPVSEFDARTLYEGKYCARGEMENRIKKQQLCLFAERTSCATLRANQLRLCLDWMNRGTQKTVLTPGRNEKRYLAGAANFRTGRVTWVLGTRKSAILFLLLLWKLHEEYPQAKKIHLILDNYSIHSATEVLSSLETKVGRRFQLHFLPPYCPQHNAIERIWLDLHANVTRNHRCRSMAELLRNVRDYLNRRNRQTRRQPLKVLAKPDRPKKTRKNYRHESRTAI